VNGLRPLDVQVTLQDFNLKSDGQYIDFSDKWETAICKGRVQTEFWNLNNLTFSESICISFQGVSTQLVDIVEELQPRYFIDGFVVILVHSLCAESFLTFSKHLKNIF